MTYFAQIRWGTGKKGAPKVQNLVKITVLTELMTVYASQVKFGIVKCIMSLLYHVKFSRGWGTEWVQ